MNDLAIVQKCLREYAKHLQALGEIPADVPDAEIFEFADQQVPRIVDALRRNKPLYQHLLEQGSEHAEAVVQEFLGMSL